MYHLAKYHVDWGSDDLSLPRIPGQLLQVVAGDSRRRV
jgi:hypothetical protein